MLTKAGWMGAGMRIKVAFLYLIMKRMKLWLCVQRHAHSREPFKRAP